MLRIHPADNVEVALTDGEPVPRGHKRAVRDIAEGEMIVKYGCPIGSAARPIAAGEHVHTHNVKTNLTGERAYRYEPVAMDAPPRRAGSFMGYVRADGRMGIRNELWIVPTVGCVNGLAERLAREMNGRLGREGVFALPHPYGCSQLGDDHLTTQRTLANLVRHPNAGGVLVLGLGCENNHIESFKRVLHEWDDARVKFLAAQDVRDEVGAGLELLEALHGYAAGFTRAPVPLSKLTVGLKCGGSDGLSGITANALVGRVSDLVVSHGGATVLTEVPEMFGAEELLMRRCETRAVFEALAELVNRWKRYYVESGQPVYENPSPGNKAGGITTLEDKSLGCTQKGGVSPVTAVLGLGERVCVPGLNVVEGPGNDMVAVTNLAAAGAQLILFTTGRGTPLGGAVPTVKVSSNTGLAAMKPGWIDFDAGRLTEGAGMEALAEELFGLVCDVASGEALTRNEVNGYREIALFKSGVTL